MYNRTLLYSILQQTVNVCVCNISMKLVYWARPFLVLVLHVNCTCGQYKRKEGSSSIDYYEAIDGIDVHFVDRSGWVEDPQDYSWGTTINTLGFTTHTDHTTNSTMFLHYYCSPHTHVYTIIILWPWVDAWGYKSFIQSFAHRAKFKWRVN